jgi:ferredoxin, 2Fe-2S
VLLGHGVRLEHACGGNCACTTCHVIVKRGFDKLSEASEQEEDLLDKAPGLTVTSRLGCQAVVEDSAAGIVVVVPRYTINQVSERDRAVA